MSDKEQKEIDAQLLRTLDAYFSKDKKFIDTSRIPLICQDISNIHGILKDIYAKLDKNFVTKESFWPVKTLVYGALGVGGTIVIGELLYLIIKSHTS